MRFNDAEELVEIGQLSWRLKERNSLIYFNTTNYLHYAEDTTRLEPNQKSLKNRPFSEIFEISLNSAVNEIVNPRFS